MFEGHRLSLAGLFTPSQPVRPKCWETTWESPKTASRELPPLRARASPEVASVSLPLDLGSPASCSDRKNEDGVVSEAFKASFKMTGSFYFWSQMRRLHAIKKSRSTTEGRGALWRDTLEDEGRP